MWAFWRWRGVPGVLCPTKAHGMLPWDPFPPPSALSFSGGRYGRPTRPYRPPLNGDGGHCQYGNRRRRAEAARGRAVSSASDGRRGLCRGGLPSAGRGFRCPWLPYGGRQMPLAVLRGLSSGHGPVSQEIVGKNAPIEFLRNFRRGPVVVMADGLMQSGACSLETALPADRLR